MLWLEILQTVVWVVPAILQLGIIALLVRKKLNQEYPFFFSYTVFQIASFCWHFYLHHYSTYEAYFYAYWTSGGINAVLGFLVIREIFFNSFRPFESLAELGRILFRWSLMVLVLVAGVVAVNAAPSDPVEAMVASVLGMERAVRVTQVGLLVFLFLFCGHLGITPKHRLFGIAFGFGMFASIELAVVTAANIYGASYAPVLSLIKGAAYTTTVAVWFGYMWAREPQRVAGTNAGTVPMFEKWNLALMPRLQPDHVFIRDIEGMVDRVISRSGPNE